MAAATERGILVAHTDFAHPRFRSVPDATPEFAWGLLIATVRNLAEEHRRMRDGAWQATTGVTLSGKTLGLIGLGRVGTRMAEYAKVFGMEVIAWSQNLTAEAAAAAGARRVEKAALFGESDVVSIHVVLSDRTRGLVGEEEFALMKPHAYLINTSRGPIVDETAMVGALQTGRIAGAGLDVFETEPTPTSNALLASDRVVCAPHVAGVTVEAAAGMAQATARTMLSVIDGAPIRENVVNKEVLD
jgi:phosphoglycerate dehydrogenase-like enzyme